MNSQSHLYRVHRFPPEIIRYAVWLYYRFSLSLRDIEDLKLPSPSSPAPRSGPVRGARRTLQFSIDRGRPLSFLEHVFAIRAHSWEKIAQAAQLRPDFQ